MKEDERYFLKLMQARCSLMRLPRESPRVIIADPACPVVERRATRILEKWARKGWYDYGVSLDTGWVTAQGMAVRFEGGKLVTLMLPPTRENFDRVADDWRRRTRHLSTWEQSKMRDGYALLVSMGRDIVPFVLGRLKDEASIDWCFLLCDLTGQAPDYRPRVQGGLATFNVERFARAWLKWGAAQNLTGGES